MAEWVISNVLLKIRILRNAELSTGKGISKFYFRCMYVGPFRCEIIKEGVAMNKPFHLMTPAERTAARIAQNRAISEKIAAEGKTQRPPVGSTGDFIRATPAERAKLGGVIRKVQR